MTSTSSHLEQRLRRSIDPPADGWRGLRARFAERADREGLLDVAYARVDSPLGALLVAATRSGIVRLAYDNEAQDTVLDELARRVSPRLLEAADRLDAVRRELDEYFQHARTRFDLPLDRTLMSGFRRDVLDATARIPYGRIATYGEVAAQAGSARAVRAAGSALATNPIPIIIPCHRILRADGELGGYRGGPERKQQLLRHEAARREER